MDHVAHREFGDLAGERSGHVRHLQDDRRHVARRCVFADAAAQVRDQRRIQAGTFAQGDEQDDAGVAFPLLAHAHGLRHGIHRLHLAVDLRGADAHAAGIQHGVAAAVNDDAAVLGTLREVAMRPHALELLEVRAAQLGAVGIVQEAHRARREGLRADQLALPARQRCAALVEDVHRHAESLALQFPRVHRQQRVAEGEAGDEIGAARDGRHRDAGLHVPRQVAEALARQRRARGEDGAQRIQPMALPGFDAGLFDAREVFGAGAEHGDALAVDEVRERLGRRAERRTIVEHQRTTACEPRDEPVPHHPAGGGEKEEPILAAEVAVQPVLLQMLQQRAADAVDDALRRPGGARGVEDVKGGVEATLGKAQRRFRAFADDAGDVLRPQQCLNGRDGGPHFEHLGLHLEGLATVAMAPGGDEELGVDLTKAIQRTVAAEVRRTG